MIKRGKDIRSGDLVWAYSHNNVDYSPMTSVDGTTDEKNPIFISETYARDLNKHCPKLWFKLVEQFNEHGEVAP